MLVLLSEGPTNSAWFEHRLLAEAVGLVLARPEDLLVRDGRVVLVRYSDRKPRLFVEPGTALKLLREIGFGTAKVNMAGWQPDQQQADV